MVYLPTGSSDQILILSCMTQNFLYLSFSTLYSSSLWRTDTLIISKLNKPSLSNKPPSLLSLPSNMPEINKPTGGLNRGFTVLTISVSTLQSCQADLVKDNGHKYFLSVLADPYMLVSNE